MSLKFLTLALTAGLVGCATQGNTPATSQAPKAFGCPVASKSVNTLEDLIAAKVETAGALPEIKVTALVCSMRNDALRIDVELANKGALEHRVAYKVRWLDRDGLAAWDEEALKPVLLYPHATGNLIGLAPTPRAVDFRLFLISQDK